MQVMKFKHIRRKIRYTIIFFLVRSLIFISRFTPRKVWLAFFGAMGSLSYYFATQSRKLTHKHLTMAYGKEKTPKEIKRMTKRVFTFMGKNGGDILWAATIRDLAGFDKFRISNNHHFAEEAFRKGKGIIFLTAHLGAFEFTATEMSYRGYQPHIIGAPMKDARLNDLLWEQRIKFGATIVERGKDTFRLIKALKRGGTTGILIDQDTRVKSVFVNFFGIPCATPVGAAVLALKTGAAVVPIFSHLNENGVQEINFYPEVELVRTGDEERDIQENTQRFSDVIEAEIRKYPEQWLWLHERWKTKPGEEIT